MSASETGNSTLPVTRDVETIALDRCRPGHCAKVAEVLADEREAGQLMAMGVCEGRTVMLLRHGDPMILKVLGSRIGVSSRLANRVRVIACNSEECDCEDCRE